VINAVKKIKLQSTTDEVQSDSLIVKEVLEANDDDEDHLGERQLCSHSMTICQVLANHWLNRKKLGETKYFIANWQKQKMY
jgi:hypothetical protein